MGWKNWVPPVFQTKASAVAKYIVQIYNGTPVWTDKNFDALAREGFETNVWVYRCVMAIAQAAAAVDWNLYQKVNSGKNLKEIEEHALLNLIARPNEFQSQQEFIESAIAFLNLSGNSYIEMNGPKSGPPMEMFSLRPDRMLVIPDTQRFIGGYRYYVNGEWYDYDAKNVMHLKFFSALDDFYGLSPISVAGRGIDQDNAANAWNAAMLQNNARPSGAMTTETILAEPQYNRLKDQIEKQYKGTSNARKPMLLEGGLKWQEMGLSPVDMDFINSKKLSRMEICAAFGVPPEIVGDKEHATYSNYQEARQSFYMETVLPMLDKLRDKLNHGLVPAFGDNLYLDYDKDNIEALQESRKDLWQRAIDAGTKGFLTKNEVREQLGYEKDPHGDIFIMPGHAWFAGDGADTIPVFVPSTPPKDPNNPDPSVDPSNPDNGGKAGKKAFGLSTDEEKTAHWKNVDGRRESYVGSVANQIQKRFQEEQKAVVAAYLKKGDLLNVQAALMGPQTTEWIKTLTAVYVMIMKDFGDSTMASLKAEAAGTEIKMEHKGLFNVFAAAVQSFIKSTVAQKVVMVTQTTMDSIKTHVQMGMDKGESINQIAARIDGLYLDQIIPNRSTVIARTEVISAANSGSNQAAKQTGLDYEREWIATRDDRTRDAHAAVDGQTVAKDEPFVVDGEKLMFPGDSSMGASAGNVIQCRCTEVYNVKK